jgi:glutamate synthase domain-containing protein 1/glutamate synthase domain-containing protein 3
MNAATIRLLTRSRGLLATGAGSLGRRKGEEEGGCGVVGFCCTEPVRAKHIHEPSKQMHNRGNGKGGGVAALGFVPEQLGVTRQVLDDFYMLHVAYLDPAVREDLERKYIAPYFDLAACNILDTVKDWTSVPDLEVRPPDVWRYFVRVKPEVLDSFVARHQLAALGRDEAEAEFINQNTFRLNQEFYASLGEKKAFVLSNGKNMMILKAVGYAETITKYYKLEDLQAHVWIAHQRFPTKGRVWHPAGAHPFGGINTALVHNGDFANYHSVCEYLAQRHIYPQFLTDTEASVLLFDLLARTYHYPLEYIIEALAPTTELDFDRLPRNKQALYRAIQATHIHGSPDGPWFFIIARTLPAEKKFQLMGITDTSMLRPQVFAFSDGEVQVGLIASEKQAIDAALRSLYEDDSRICPVADRYWNARGGSHTDGGAFIFELSPWGARYRMSCTDKFGAPVPMPAPPKPCDLSYQLPRRMHARCSAPEPCDFRASYDVRCASLKKELQQELEAGGGAALFEYARARVADWDLGHVRELCEDVAALAREPKYVAACIEGLTLLNDRRYSTGAKRHSHVLHLVREALGILFGSLPEIAAGEGAAQSPFRLIDYQTRRLLRAPHPSESTLVINSRSFPPEGPECDSALLLDAYLRGWRHFIVFNCAGQRFTGCGLGPGTTGVTIDVYGSSGDYLGSGIDGLTITVHGNAQDQLGQIIKSGRLVVHGDVGQTFMYGAKGGEVYVMGNAAGRPLINSVGRPRVVINGTCLDFLAESFMAGDPLNGGGFVVLNGVTFDENGRLLPLSEPYPGSNLFSLASGGAIYIRDPHQYCVPAQLNGARFKALADEDWDLIRPYLEENERLFGIKVDDLLTVDGEERPPSQVYRKVVAVAGAALASAKKG